MVSEPIIYLLSYMNWANKVQYSQLPSGLIFCLGFYFWKRILEQCAWSLIFKVNQSIITSPSGIEMPTNAGSRVSVIWIHCLSHDMFIYCTILFSARLFFPFRTIIHSIVHHHIKPYLYSILLTMPTRKSDEAPSARILRELGKENATFEQRLGVLVRADRHPELYYLSSLQLREIRETIKQYKSLLVNPWYLL